MARTSRRTLPARIAPMLAELANEPFDSDEHLFEIKWDGIRCIALHDTTGLRLQNRRFTELRERFPELSGLTALPPGTAVDGEIVILKDGKPSFELLQQRMHQTDSRRITFLSRRIPATFMAFDLLYQNYKPCMGEALTERRARLAPLIEILQDQHVVATDFVIGPGTKYFAAAQQAGLEGVMAKRLDSAYLPGKRSPAWVKIKVPKEAVFDIVGYVPRKGERVVSALVIGVPDGSRWDIKGKVGSGFTDAQRAEFFAVLSTKKKWPKRPQDGPKDAVWVESGLRCRVRYLEETSEGKLRAPVFAGLVH